MKKLLIALLLISSLFISCSKEEIEQNKKPIEWTCESKFIYSVLNLEYQFSQGYIYTDEYISELKKSKEDYENCLNEN